MFVAVCDHVVGTSTSVCRNIVFPLSFLISIVRCSHSTSSNGFRPGFVKFRENSSPSVGRRSSTRYRPLSPLLYPSG